MDSKARKRIEELHLLTSEIVKEYHDMKNYKYDYKLYRKYKQLKERNKKLQEKIINQHCSGCKCFIQINENKNEDTNEYIVSVDSKNSTIIENKKKTSSINSKNNSESSSDDENEEMDTNENIPKTTINDTVIEEEEEEEEGEYDSNIRLRLYPAICRYLINKSRSGFDYKPSKVTVHSFIVDQIKPQSIDYEKINLRIRNELLEIHQLYMQKLMSTQENKTPTRRSQRQRRSL
ncbi:unnamed protein product [Rotaria sordida]|uniref:Uncharacterized protein n=1 Tax=Rotaria sordida TaxID=392033 RepID=A0A818TXH0_9BILA|nr:unnamed protein product [Rotaria sordida]